MGLGLAVPMNATTQAILSALMRNGRVRRAFLGIAASARLFLNEAPANLKAYPVSSEAAKPLPWVLNVGRPRLAVELMS
jgi:hypothetical protein